jgi:hypothetical protein
MTLCRPSFWFVPGAVQRSRANPYADCYRWLRLALILLLLALPLCSRASAAVGIKLDEITVEGGNVRFRVGSCSLDNPVDLQKRQEMPVDETTHYFVYLDLSNSGRTNFGYFVYRFVVQPKEPQSYQVCAFAVQAFSTGSFIDQIAEVPFHVGEVNQTEDGSIHIPVHSLSFSKALIESHPPQRLCKVSLSSETPILLNLTNLLQDLPVEVGSDIRVVPESPENWKAGSQFPRATLQLPTAQGNVLRAGDKLDIGIRLVLNPDPWHALGASIFPIEPEKPHEVIHLSLDYRALGGTAATLQIPVPIRYAPSFWDLLVAVLVGSLVGSIGGRFLPQPTGKQPARWFVGVASGFVFAVLAEGLGMILVLAKSNFRLFAFELDPYQMLPAALIGALVGLAGFRRSEDFLKLFKKAP